LSLREAYLFLRNLFGLLFHPYKTMRAIRREQDFSQFALLSLWPFLIWLILFFSIAVIKFFWHPGLINQAAKTAFILCSLFAIFHSLYLAYWLFFYLKIEKKRKFNV